MATAKCLKHGCSITPRTMDNGGYCHKHKHLSATYQSGMSSRLEDKAYIQRLHLPPKMAVVRSEARITRNIISGSTNLDPDITTRLVLQSNRVIAAGKDLTVPNEARFRKNAARDLMEAMTEAGVPEGSMRVVTMKGLGVVTPEGKRKSASKQTHEVLCIKNNRGEDILVDPVISQFALVPDRDKSVDDQLDSGVTPFGDFPWTGTPSEYMDGSFMWWESSDL